MTAQNTHKKPTLVLLPGMMCDGRLFDAQVEALQVSHDICIADLTQQDSIADIAKQVLEFIAVERFSVCGLSMGGIVAMEMIRQAPDRIDQLVLMNTNHLAELPHKRANRWPQIQRALAGELRSVLIEDMKPMYLSPNSQNHDEILSVVLDMAEDLGEQVFKRQSEALADRPDASDVLASYAGRSLVLSGADDHLCPLARHEEMTRLLPNAELMVVPNCGHLSTMEAPETINQILTAFFNPTTTTINTTELTKESI